MALRANIETPDKWILRSRDIVIRGWCFHETGTLITGIRLIASDQCLMGITGLLRTDVKQALPEAPNNYTGFEIRGILASGRYTARIEARSSDGTWLSLAQPTIKVARRWRPLFLGGGNWSELLHAQMPTQALYPPRPVRKEAFPDQEVSFSRIPQISIVTPSFNQGRYLPETMRSVLDQPGCNIEYVIQDGGSTDDSVVLISRVSDRLHAWSSAPDQGQADAICRGFAQTTGAPNDVMAWINSDDYYLPGALAFVASYFARHPDVDAVYGHRIVVDEDSREIARWFVPPHDSEVLRHYDFIPQETLFWRRRIWDQVGGIDRSFQFAVDWDLLLRFEAAGARIVRVPYFLGCFRVHPAQKTSARIHDQGEAEMARLRQRTFGRQPAPAELEANPHLHRYLRRSARIEALWRCGWRAR